MCIIGDYFLYLHCVFHGIRLLRLIKNLIYREISIFQTPCAIQDIFCDADGSKKGSLRRFPFYVNLLQNSNLLFIFAPRSNHD